MDKFTNIVIPIYFEFINFWYILHPNIYVMDGWNLDEKSLRKWQYLQRCIYVMSKNIHKGCQTMLALQLMPVTLHMWFAFNIEQDK